MSSEATEPVIYAGFWRRVFAKLIDGCLLLAGLLVLSHVVGQPGVLLRDDGLPGVAVALVGLLYEAFFESSRWQATPGKRVVGIQVTDLEGQRIGFGRAALRHVAQFLSALCLMLGYLMGAFTRRRRCLHDLIAGTLVVRAGLDPVQIAHAPLARPWSRWMIAALVAPVLAIGFAGWLLHEPRERPEAGAPASPDHDRYHARTEVAAALYYASDAIDTAENLYGESKNFASVNVPEMDLDAEAARTIAMLKIVSGSIRITFGGESDPVLQGRTAALTPAVDDSGNVIWICGYADAPDGYEPIRDDYRSLTNISPDALPPDCLPQEGGDEGKAPASGLKV
jgi:uncharacterized RDD family membrane protein YckC